MAVLGADFSRQIHAIERQMLDKFGVSLTTGHDFDDYQSFLRTARPQHKLGDPFSPDLHDIKVGELMWAIGRDRLGQIVLCQAFRLLPTGDASIADYYKQNFRYFSPSEIDVDFERSTYCPGPCARKIWGRIVYSGETWISDETNKYRGTGFSALLGRYVFLMSLHKFNADYLLGFMTGPVAEKGFSIRFGFAHAEPMALTWYSKDGVDPVQVFMVYNSKEDMKFYLGLPIHEVDVLAA
ncbi:MAG: hypothetical protein AAF755_02665 [Pseudomonadota bacterium]